MADLSIKTDRYLGIEELGFIMGGMRERDLMISHMQELFHVTEPAAEWILWPPPADEWTLLYRPVLRPRR